MAATVAGTVGGKIADICGDICAGSSASGRHTDIKLSLDRDFDEFDMGRFLDLNRVFKADLNSDSGLAGERLGGLRNGIWPPVNLFDCIGNQHRSEAIAAKP
ncbi:MAG: hypothetical protein CVV27_00825 [Candidatus Melainabacteria bacterium HGW-Melainabacteria-1]|nr:MAG: hypothetical protein CVV27_00825 [Candidatus Melainabacteria bacterium HGW-Melainabacteria-1]